MIHVLVGGGDGRDPLVNSGHHHSIKLVHADGRNLQEVVQDTESSSKEWRILRRLVRMKLHHLMTKPQHGLLGCLEAMAKKGNIRYDKLARMIPETISIR